MKALHFLTIILLTFTLQSCFIGADGDTEDLAEDYYISGALGFKNVHLGYWSEYGGAGLIESPIIAVGVNDQYIIVKREADNFEYYIVKITKSGNRSEAEDNITGPLTENEFNIAIKELDLQSISWTKEFEK